MNSLLQFTECQKSIISSTMTVKDFPKDFVGRKGCSKPPPTNDQSVIHDGEVTLALGASSACFFLGAFLLLEIG